MSLSSTAWVMAPVLGPLRGPAARGWRLARAARRSVAWPSPAGPWLGREGDHRCWHGGGGGRFQGGVDRDQPVEPVDGDHAPDDLRGDHQPQLRAVGGGPLVGTHHSIGARAIAQDRGGHIGDQLDGAAVDNRQQLPAARRPVGVNDLG
jgi:hypothetical protein